MNKNGRGMNLVISLLLIVLLVFWFSGILRSMEDTCTQAEFNQMLDAGEISGAVVVQNREVPTGSVEVHLTSGDEKVLVVSDVNPVLEELETAGVKTIVRDVPGDNIFLTSILPALITVGGVLLIFMMMNAQNAQMNGGNKMMNFGKSRARLSLAGDSKVTLKDVAGLKEEKEDLQEIVDFLRDPGKFTKVGARIPKGVLLEGPPGTGKTSIARSVAEALNKKYVRISLGGVRDEAEIRGHRRTYVGSMPGRIVNGLRQAGVKNPLMLLDEVDKVSSDYKGDTASALLEVLDAEQNRNFRDHYVEIPIDLSEVLFVVTANTTETIPRPLLDRMEVIEVSSYTAAEKFHIAREHLMPKQLKKNGMQGRLIVSDNALRSVIEGYTREAGVRGLERKLGEICRKAARELLKEDKSCIRVNDRNLEKYLGKPRFHSLKANQTDEIGIVRGLAWTSVGGDTLQIEVNMMPGKGELELTGQLGDVMKESAMTGLSYIRSVSERYQIDPDVFKKNDFHIHIPEGAVPKDGPSAGITMATALLSALTHTPVRADLAMTGEITLRGRVLPIGGLKEKTLAAKTAGIKTVLVPEKNRPDVEEIPAEIKNGLEILFVETMDDVIAHAFVGGKGNN